MLLLSVTSGLPLAVARRKAFATLRALTPARGRPAAWVPVALAAVFVVAVVAAWPGAAQSRCDWRITDVVAPAGIVAATDDVQVGAAQRGGLLRIGSGSEIELQLGRELRFLLLGNGSIDLPPPLRWFSGEVLITVHEGEIYGTTGSGSLDLPLRVVSRDAEAEIRGTKFAIP